MDALPVDLVARLRERARSAARNDAVHGTLAGTYPDWADAVAAMEEDRPGSGHTLTLLEATTRSLGWPMLPMHLFRQADGTLSASTDLPPGHHGIRTAPSG